MVYNPGEIESQALKAGAFSNRMPDKRARFQWQVEENYYSDISVLTTAASPVTLFTVTGLVEAKVVGVSGSALASTGNTGTLAIGVTGATTGLLGTTTIDGTNFPAANTVWSGDTSPTLLGEAMSSASLNGFLTASNIILTIATNNMTTGSIRFCCIWRPVSYDGSVVSAR